MKKIKSVIDWFFSKKRRLIVAALILLAVGYLFVKRGSNSNPVKIQTATVTKGTIISTVTASGNVVSSNITPVNSQASGIISKVFVTEGDKVVAGQKIAEVNLDLDGQQSQTQAYANYLSAKNSLDSANTATYTLNSSMWAAEQKFQNDSVARGLTTDDPTYIQENDDWLAAEAKYKQQAGIVAQAKIALNNAWLSYKQTQSTITAPISGTVSSLVIAEGMSLSTQTSSSGGRTGQRVASITTPGNPLVSVDISEIDVPNIKIGQKATITFDSITDKTFSGKVVAVDRVGTTTSNVTNYPTIIALDTGSDQILPNMAATANIITQIKNDVLMVPSTAITQQGGQSVVTVIQNGKQQTVSVETGISSDSETEITSGLTEGEEVVTGTTSTSSTSSTRSVFGGGGFGGARFIGR